MEYRIGTMNEAYTVGRTELVAWLNRLLETRYTKVEEVSNGLSSKHTHTAAPKPPPSKASTASRSWASTHVAQERRSARSWTRAFLAG